MTARDAVGARYLQDSKGGNMENESVVVPEAKAPLGELPPRPKKIFWEHVRGVTHVYLTFPMDEHLDTLEATIQSLRDELSVARNVSAAFDTVRAQKEAACNLRRAEAAESALSALRALCERLHQERSYLAKTIVDAALGAESETK